MSDKKSGASIKVRDVSVIFQDRDDQAIAALEEVNLDVKAGEFVSILGPGCGSSVLLRLIAGLDKPTTGEILLNHEAIQNPHFISGLVYKDTGLLPWLTAEDNVAFGLGNSRFPQVHENEVKNHLSLVGLDGSEKLYPHELTEEGRLKAALARALVSDPQVLLMDDPLAGLDGFRRMVMQDEILRICQQKGVTTLLATHDIDEAVYLSDRIVILSSEHGKIQDMINVSLSTPRSRNSIDFFKIRSRILEIFNFATEYTLSYYL